MVFASVWNRLPWQNGHAAGRPITSLKRGSVTGAVLLPSGERGDIVRATDWRSRQRSTSRIVSDMVGGGTLQRRTINAGGTTSSTATRVHPAKDVVPDT